MISCTEFIPAYSELFKFLHAKAGKQAVIDFWISLSNNFLTNLRDLAEQKGLQGCWEYWNHTLKEEAADCTMTLDEENGIFQIEMHRCPSKSRLMELKHITPYPDYCEHCDILYRNILEPLGFDYSIDFSRCDQAICKVTIKKPS